MHQDCARREVEGQIVEDVAQLDVGALAQGDDPREADPLVGRPVEHRGRDRIRLGDEGEVAIGRQLRGGAGVELHPRHHHADPVGPDHADAVPACRRAHRPGLPGIEGDRAGSAADHHDGAAADAGELVDQGRQIGLRQAHDREAGFLRQRGEPVEPRRLGCPAGAAQGMDRTGEARIPEIGFRDADPAGSRPVRADPQDALRLEQVTQAA